jgi:hypothetical protein
MPLPARRVFASAISVYFGPIEYDFHPAAQRAGRLVLHVPDRLQCLHDEGRYRPSSLVYPRAAWVARAAGVGKMSQVKSTVAGAGEARQARAAS